MDHSGLILLNISVLTAGNGNLSTHHRREAQAARLPLRCKLFCWDRGERTPGLDRSNPPGPPGDTPGWREARTPLSSARSYRELACPGSHILQYGGDISYMYSSVVVTPPIPSLHHSFPRYFGTPDIRQLQTFWFLL